MDAERMIRIAEIRERVERSEYEVDPQLVAAAIVERLAAARPAHTCADD